MTAVLAADAAAPPRPAPAQARSVVAGYAGTLSVPLAAVAALLGIWASVAALGWPAAAAAVAGWVLLAGTWLHRRGWSAARLHAVTVAAPLTLLAAPLAAGRLSPGGLVLWAPLTGLCAIALALVHRPASAASSRSAIRWHLRERPGSGW